jgi:hypothetical protein
MSDTPVREHEAADPLVEALRHLPARALDGSVEARRHRQARAAYLREFEGSAWCSSAAGLVGRVAVPVFLAGVVGLYMTWAIAAATALVH